MSVISRTSTSASAPSSVSVPDGDMAVRSGTIATGCEAEDDEPLIVKAFNTTTGTFDTITPGEAPAGDSEFTAVACTVAGPSDNPVIVFMQSNETPASGTTGEVKHCMLTVVPVLDPGARRTRDIQSDFESQCYGNLLGTDAAVAVSSASNPHAYRLSDLSTAWTLRDGQGFSDAAGSTFIIQHDSGFLLNDGATGKTLASSEELITPIGSSTFFGTADNCIDGCGVGKTTVLNARGGVVGTILDPGATSHVSASDNIIAAFDGPINPASSPGESDFFETYDAKSGKLLFGKRGTQAGALRINAIYAVGTDVYMSQDTGESLSVFVKIDGRTGATLTNVVKEFPVAQLPKGWTVVLRTGNGVPESSGHCQGFYFDDDCLVRLEKQ